MKKENYVLGCKSYESFECNSIYRWINARIKSVNNIFPKHFVVLFINVGIIKIKLKTLILPFG